MWPANNLDMKEVRHYAKSILNFIDVVQRVYRHSMYCILAPLAFTLSFLGLLYSLYHFDVVLPNIPILPSKVQCIGNETSLLECSYSSFSHHHCDHRDDIILGCVGKKSTHFT